MSAAGPSGAIYTMWKNDPSIATQQSQQNPTQSRSHWISRCYRGCFSSSFLGHHRDSEMHGTWQKVSRNHSRPQPCVSYGRISDLQPRIWAVCHWCYYSPHLPWRRPADRRQYPIRAVCNSIGKILVWKLGKCPQARTSIGIPQLEVGGLVWDILTRGTGNKILAIRTETQWQYRLPKLPKTSRSPWHPKSRWSCSPGPIVSPPPGSSHETTPLQSSRYLQDFASMMKYQVLHGPTTLKNKAGIG